jgi:hypothetical protein
VSEVEHKFRLRLLFQEIDLLPGNFIIGRASTCNLTVEDPLVSREHARILVYPDRAEMHDMSSRNGTQLNGEPVQGGERLKHGDRIRVGSYEFTFIVDLPNLEQAHHRATMRSYLCPKCKTVYTEDNEACPECGESQNASELDGFMRKLEETAPVDMEDSFVEHKSQMLDEVLQMAISMGHWDKAAGFLQNKIAAFEQATDRGKLDRRALIGISEGCLTVARGLEDKSRIDWVIDTWAHHRVGMPKELIRALEEAAFGWYDLEPGLTRYLAALEINEENEETRLSLLARLRGKPSSSP